MFWIRKENVEIFSVETFVKFFKDIKRKRRDLLEDQFILKYVKLFDTVAYLDANSGLFLQPYERQAEIKFKADAQ